MLLLVLSQFWKEKYWTGLSIFIHLQLKIRNLFDFDMLLKPRNFSHIPPFVSDKY